MLCVKAGSVVETKRSRLEMDVTRYRKAAYASTTKATYKAQLKKYLQFCHQLSYEPVPPSSNTLCQYAAPLALSMRPSSIRQYLNVVRLLHLESGCLNPLEGNWFLQTVLKGIQRTKGDAINQKLPITQQILAKFATVLNLNKSIDLTFLAACLVAFYGMLRKSSLFPKHRAMSHMRVDCCEFQSPG